jgi:Zn-finger protein
VTSYKYSCQGVKDESNIQRRDGRKIWDCKRPPGLILDRKKMKNIPNTLEREIYNAHWMFSIIKNVTN